MLVYGTGYMNLKIILNAIDIPNILFLSQKAEKELTRKYTQNRLLLHFVNIGTYVTIASGIYELYWTTILKEVINIIIIIGQ